MAVRSKSHGCNARSVNDATYAILPRSFQNRARAIHIRSIHLLRIAQPEAVVGGDVKYRVASKHSLLQRRRIAQVAGRSFGVQSFKIFQIAARADKQAQLRSLPSENASDMRAEKSGSACDESFQEQS